tara:strand:+ start:2059 stop:2241 length:183 start_codon:yes stop_codon:yes gene_type:complete
MDIKLIAVVLIIAIVINLILFVFGLISKFWFWIIIIVIGFIAYKILPKLKNENKKHSGVL